MAYGFSFYSMIQCKTIFYPVPCNLPMTLQSRVKALGII